MNAVRTTVNRRGEFDELFSELLGGFGKPLVSRGGAPRYRWTEDEKYYVLQMEATGFDKKEVSVERDGNQLFIQAERAEPKEGEDRWVLLHDFKRVFRLPDELDEASKIEANLEGGILEVKVAKTKKRSSRTLIKIN